MRIGRSISIGIIRRPIITIVTWNDSLNWIDSNTWTE